MATALTQDDLKRIAAYKAVEHVKSGMVIGLGTGSTAKHAVDRIAELIRQGRLKDITGIATSVKTQEQALSLGIPLSIVDLAIDGADEGFEFGERARGSLLREKMVESVSHKFIVIADESKLMPYIGGSGLGMPVEVIPFCWKHSLKRLVALFGKLRECADSGEAYVSDNGNYIMDLNFEKDIGDLNEASDAMLRLPGIVDHGMFIGLATTVIVAGLNGVTVNTKEFVVDSYSYNDFTSG